MIKPNAEALYRERTAAFGLMLLHGPEGLAAQRTMRKIRAVLSRAEADAKKERRCRS